MSEQYTTARLTRDKERFEILVKPDKAFDYRMGKIKSISEVLVTETIFTDVGKGQRAPEEKLQKTFGTVDPIKIAEEILKTGTLQITSEQRRRLIEEKRRRIIAFISKQCVDPKTGLPHPPTRIEQAMEQIHFSIDPSREVEEQAKEIIKMLRSVLPLKIENLNVVVRIPPEYVGKVYGTVKGFGTIKKEEWKADGSWIAVVEMPAGVYGSFLEKIGEMTRGNIETKVI